MQKRLFHTVMLAVFALVAVGCDNPAANAPQAQVADPAAADPNPQPSVMGVVYDIDEEASKVEFVGSKVTGSHEGGFADFDGTITLVDGTPEGSEVAVEIDATSLWADDEQLTGHLKSPDFFDVETYPEASFTSSSITPNDDGTYTITGNLMLHGVTKQISFPAMIEVGEESVSAEAEFAIKRFDFDIEYKGRADDLIRDDVLIKLDIEADRAA